MGHFKKVSTIFLLTIVSIFFLSTPMAYAVSGPQQLNEGNTAPVQTNNGSGGFLDLSLNSFSCGEPVINEDVDKYLSEFKEKEANMAEKFLVEQAESVWQVGPINTMNSLIFGNPYCIWAGEGAEMSSDGIFTVNEREKVVEPFLKLFSGIYVLVLALAIMFTGLKMALAGFNGRALSVFGEDLKMWMFSGFFILAYSMFLNLLFQLNASFVITIRDMVSGSGISLIQSSMMNTGYNPISFVIVTFAEWLLSLILNFIYMARKAIICLLIVLGYVAAFSLLFSKSRAFFGVWLKELIGNVFLPSIHAVIYFTMIQFAAAGAGMFFKMGLLMMFIPISGMISKWLNFGDSSSKVGNAMSMVGMGGVASTFMLMSQAGNILRGGSMFSSGSSNSNSTSAFSTGSNSELSNAVNMNQMSSNALNNDAQTTAISADAKGQGSSSWNSTKSSLSKVAGGMGAAAGLVGGPVGAVLGYKAASSASNMLLQGGRNMTMGGSNVMSHFNNAKQFTSADGKSGFGAMLADPTARRAFFGNMGESVGSMVGLGAAGRGVGFALSGVSRQALMQDVAKKFNLTDAENNLMPATFQNLAAQYPGADVKFAQTGMSSGFFVQQNGEWQQIGASGAGDSSLKPGEMRMMDYKMADSMNESYTLQPNGTYTAKPKDASELMNMANMANVSPHVVSDSQGGIPSATGAGFQTSQMDANLMDNVMSQVNQMTGPTVSETPLMSGVESAATSPLMSDTASSTLITPSGHSNSESPLMSGSLPPLSEMPTSNSQTIGALPPLSEMPNSQSNEADYGTKKQQSRSELAGLQGSTPYLMRTSDAYIVNPSTGAPGGLNEGTAVNPNVAYSLKSGHITNDVINQAMQTGTQRYADGNFRANAVTPDAYVYHNAAGAPTRTASDRVADVVEKQTSTRQTWAKKFQEQRSQRRFKEPY